MRISSITKVGQTIYSAPISTKLQGILNKWNGGSIDISRNGGQTKLILNRQEKGNAFSGTMMIELKEKIEEINSSSDCGIVVVQGSGQVFCSGADLGLIKEIADPTLGKEMFEYMSSILSSLHNSTYISIANINGHCMGGATEICSSCDIRAAHKDAKLNIFVNQLFHIGFLQSRLGIIPSWGGASYLESIIGRSTAIRLMATAAIISAQEAKQLGYIDVIYDNNDQFEEFSASLLHSGPIVAKAQKAMLNAVRTGRKKDEFDVISSVWGGEAQKKAIQNQLNNLKKKK